MTCDAVVIGGGHNGLVAAWRLAKAGKKVVVCEARAVLGGLAAADEFHPGYSTQGVLHDSTTWRSWLSEEMKLADHGWKSRPAPPVAIPLPTGEVASVSRRSGEIALAAVEDGDREAYEAWRRFLVTVGPVVRRLLDRRPARLDAGGIRDLVGLAGDGWALRRLGRAAMTELLRVGPMPVADWLRESFQSQSLIEALMMPALLGTWLGPHSAGSTANLLAHECVAGEETVGGSSALIAALTTACEAVGVEFSTATTVQRILVEAGAVVAIRSKNGGEIGCSQILASCNPRLTLLDLLPPAVLPLAIRDQIANLRCRGTVAKLHIALEGPLTLGGRNVEVVRLGAGSIDAFEQAFDAVKYRRVSQRPVLEVVQPSVADSSVSPDGGHVLSVVAGYVPYELAGGWTAAAKEKLEQRVLDRLEGLEPGLRGRIVATQTLTPVDLEDRYGLPGGQLQHGEHALDQLLFVRPSHRLAHYKTPVEGLFLAGSGSHPGGGITGVPGWLAAGTALES